MRGGRHCPNPTTPIATARCSFRICTWERAAVRPISFSTCCAMSTRTRSIWSATSSTAGGCARAGTGRRRTTTSCRSCLRKVRRGARMVFVPGNHDEFARQFFGLTFGGIEIKRQAIHTAADGKRYLVIHGDEFDVVVRHSKWLAYFGDWAYDLGAVRQHPFQRRAPGARPALLVVFGLGEAQGQERGQFHRLVRERACGRSQEARRRRRRLRSYPSPDHPRHRGRDLCQHRRFRRILLARGRAPRRPVRSAALEDSPASRAADRGSRLVRGRTAQEAQAEAA